MIVPAYVLLALSAPGSRWAACAEQINRRVPDRMPVIVIAARACRDATTSSMVIVEGARRSAWEYWRC